MTGDEYQRASGRRGRRGRAWSAHRHRAGRPGPPGAGHARLRRGTPQQAPAPPPPTASGHPARATDSLYLARIPAGLAILVPLVAVAFATNCLVTSYESPLPPTSVSFYGVTAPEHLDQAGLQTWLLQHPQQAANGLPSARPPPRRRSARRSIRTSRPTTATTSPARS